MNSKVIQEIRYLIGNIGKSIRAYIKAMRAASAKVRGSSLAVLLMVWMALLMMKPFAAEARTTALTIPGDHGKLAAIMQTPDNRDTYPMVIIMHGFSASKDGALLKLIADDLEQAGIASIRFDFNGHGDSEGRFEDMTVLNEISDARHVFEYVKAEAPNKEAITSISLVGHSQGGVVASMLAGELAKEQGSKVINSVVLLAPAGNIADGLIGSNFFSFQFDTEQLPEVVELPSGLRIGRDYFKTAYNLPIYDTAKQYEGPVEIIQGSADDVVPERYSRRFERAYGDKRAELHVLDAYDHEFTQNRQAVAQMVTDFVKTKAEATANGSQSDLMGTISSWWQQAVHWLAQIRTLLGV